MAGGSIGLHERPLDACPSQAAGQRKELGHHLAGLVSNLPKEPLGTLGKA